VRAVVQRVLSSSVEVDGKIVGKIAKGIMLLLGIGNEDNEDDVKYLVNKVLELRIFKDDDGKMNKSLIDIGGELLVVSQFTLYGDCRKGRRPSYDRAASPEKAKELYEIFINVARERINKVESGVFQAMMKVDITNDGPVTLLIDSKRMF